MIRRQRGAALVVVLLIVALVSVAAVNINERIRFSSQRLQNHRLNEQAYWYALGGEQLARVLIEEEIKSSSIHLGQPWATRDAVFPIDGGVLLGQIKDAQACFNINNLQRPKLTPGEEPVATVAEKQFQGLLQLLEIPAEVAEPLRDRLPDWLDTDLMPQGFNGAEDLYYSNQDLPFQPPNAPALSVSELELLVPFKAEHRDALNGYLCALPLTDSKLNINTLPVERAPLLAAMLENQITVSEAKTLLELRPPEGWKEVSELLEDPVFSGKKVSAEATESLAITSAFFRATIDVQYHHVQMRLYSMISTQNQTVAVYAREYGELF